MTDEEKDRKVFKYSNLVLSIGAMHDLEHVEIILGLIDALVTVARVDFCDRCGKDFIINAINEHPGFAEDANEEDEDA